MEFYLITAHLVIFTPELHKPLPNQQSLTTALGKTKSKLKCYLAVNREYTVTDYLTTVTDRKLRKKCTMYRLSEHSLDKSGDVVGP